MQIRNFIVLCAALAAGALQATAQPFGPTDVGPGNVFQIRVAPPNGDMLYVRAEMDPGKVVKGAPYSAETTTEVTQVLADGNRIYRKQAGALYRDSEGRTRREQPIAPIGPLGAAPGAGKAVFVFINDPVAQVSYTLDPNRKEARKLSPPPPEFTAQIKADMEAGRAIVAGDKPRMFIRHVEVQGAGEPGLMKRGIEEQITGSARKESLGTKMFDSVAAEGTKITTTIPAGQIGNERAIESTTETWYSQQLQAVVMSRNYDPRFGETIYRLSNINVDDPAQTLFQVPADYTVVEMPPPPGHGGGDVIMHKR